MAYLPEQKTHRGFLRNCLRNQKSCPLAASVVGSAEDDAVQELDRQIQDVFRSAAMNPQVVSNSAYGPGIVDAGTLQTIYRFLIYGTTDWPFLADVFADYKAGRMRKIYELWLTMDRQPSNVPTKFGNHVREQPNLQDIEMAMIGCLDSMPVGDELRSVEGRIHFAREMQRMSPTGELWAG